MAKHTAVPDTVADAELADAIAERVTQSVPGTVSYRDALAAAAADAIAEFRARTSTKSLDRA